MVEEGRHEARKVRGAEEDDDFVRLGVVRHRRQHHLDDPRQEAVDRRQHHVRLRNALARFGVFSSLEVAY